MRLSLSVQTSKTKRETSVARSSSRDRSKMFARSVLVALCCIAAASLTDAATKLATFVTPCSLKDPKLDDCLVTQSNALLPHIVAGVKDWGIPPMDPLFLPLTQLQNGGRSNVGLSLTITNASHYGWKDMAIKSMKFDSKTLELDFKVFFPTYAVQGTYNVDGRVLLLPIRGNGLANLTFQTVDARNVIKCQLEERGAKKYLKVTSAVNTFDLKHVHYKLDNLFGNKQLSDAMNDVLNQNPLEAFNDLKQPIQDMFSDLYFSILGRMFAKIPVNQMFKDFE